MSDVRRESHLVSAELTEPEWIRGVLAGLPACPFVAPVPGVVAIARDDVVAAGLDTLSVTRWLQPLGGYGAVAYLRPTSHKAGPDACRPALHPVSYYVVPLEALRQREDAESRDDAPSVAAA